MRSVAMVGLLIVVACSQPSPSPSPTQSPAAGAGCRLPVWWGQAAFLSVPSRRVDHVQPWELGFDERQQGSEAAVTYAGGRWLPVARKLVSSDGSRYVYRGDSTGDIVVVDIATGATSVAYHGLDVYDPIAFASEGIYLLKENPSTGEYLVYQNLYRLDPRGSVPQFVPGSDRHMDRAGWSLIADGAAWGIDETVDPTGGRTDSVLRLDLSTGEVTTWFTSPLNVGLWPVGVDAQHRLWVNSTTTLWRLAAAGSALEQPWEPIPIFSGPSIDTGFVSGPEGVWLPGRGGVWLYADVGDPRYFIAGPVNEITYPVGSCRS